MTILFWFDLLPNYGTSTNIAEFNEHFSSGFRCFFGADSAIQTSVRCSSDCGGFGILFVLFYMMSYIFGTGLTLFRSANLLSVAIGLSPVIAMVFWYAFPSVNSWAGGTNYPLDSFDGLANILAMPIMIAGIYTFRHFETESRDPDEDELDSGPVELCVSPRSRSLQ